VTNQKRWDAGAQCIVAPPCLLPEPGNGAKGMVSDHQFIFKMG